MLLDNNGDALLIFTPPSLHSRFVSKTSDRQHAAKLFRLFQEKEKTDPARYRIFHFSSHENPYISEEALAEISSDMTSLSYRMEIMAEDIDEATGALWTRKIIEDNRTLIVPPIINIKPIKLSLKKIMVAK